MAIKGKISPGSLFSSFGLNGQSREWLGALKPTNIGVLDPSSGLGRIAISNLSLACGEAMVQINDVEITYDENAITPPYYLTIRVQDNKNTPYKIVNNFEFQPTGLTLSSSMSLVGIMDSKMELIELSKKPKEKSMVLSKNTSEAIGEIFIEEDIDVSRSFGLSVSMTPYCDTAEVTDLYIILDETTTLGTYSRYDFTFNSNNIDKDYKCDFNSPSSIVGTPAFDAIKRVIIGVGTTVNVASIYVNNITILMDSTVNKPNDDGIEFSIREEINNLTPIARLETDTWVMVEPNYIPNISSGIETHLGSENIHIPENIKAVIEASIKNGGSSLITLSDIASLSPDSEAQCFAVAKASIRSVEEPGTRSISPVSNTAIRADAIKHEDRVGYNSGVNNFIDTNPIKTTSVFKGSYYTGLDTPTKISTPIILNQPGKLNTILVAIDSINSTLAPVTFDFFLDDINVLSGADIGSEYNISSAYQANGLQGTSARIEFNIPAVNGALGDVWTSRQPCPVSSFGTRLCMSPGGLAYSVTKDNNFVYSGRTDSWKAARSSTLPITVVFPHPSSNLMGPRIIPLNDSRGEQYVSSTDTWINMRGHGFSEGRCVELSRSRFIVVRDSNMEMMSDQNGTNRVLSGPGSAWKDGGVGVAQKDIWILGGTDSAGDVSYVKRYNIFNETWSTSPVAISATTLNGYASTSSGDIYSIGGSNGPGPISNMQKLDTNNGTITNMASMGVPAKRVGAGLSRQQTIIAFGGELSSGSEQDCMQEYLPDQYYKFLGFSLKAGFFRLTLDADHVARWTEDTAEDFFVADPADVAYNGYWSDDDGLIYGGVGPYWGFYGRWAPVGLPQYDSATFEQRWKNGYWGDINGKIGTDQAPSWDEN